MTFLQPLILFALPLIGLPILIHLINQNRHKTIHWAATMFLLQAKRMARGMARLRYWLIMAARMLAVAGLIFAVSRPMAGGWLGLTAGSTPDTTIIVLDRSASMEQQGAGTSLSKRDTAIGKLVDLITNTGRNTKLLLFESTSVDPIELSSADDLDDLPRASATSTSADIPGLMQSVADYILTNETGRTDVWVCSDLRQTDWNPSGGRWDAIRTQLADRDGVRMYLLTYPTISPDNVSVSVSGVHRRESPAGAELVMDIKLARAAMEQEDKSVPLSIVINGARSTLDTQMTGPELIRNGHTIPIDRELKAGWGRIEIPGDTNNADNVFRFTYAEPAIQKTVVISDDSENAELLRLAASTAVDRSLTYDAEVFPIAGAAAIPWDETALILWHAPLPDGILLKQLSNFVESGRTVIFFPTESPGDKTAFGVTWGTWNESPTGEPFTVDRWRTDSDLLGNTLSGSPLPLGDITVSKYCSLDQEKATLLAQLPEGVPLLARAVTDQGAVYFCSTLPDYSHSTLADNGVVFFIMIHRALARGASVLGAARQLDAGMVSASQTNDWKPLDELSADVLISQRHLKAGLYEGEEALFAINRPISEDSPNVVTEETLAQSMSGLSYTIIDDEAGSQSALANEVWRTFLIAMICALLIEALLCMPEKQPATASTPTLKPISKPA